MNLYFSRMRYALRIGLLQLRSKKRSTVSLVTVIAVIAVALGVSALSSVLVITTGFQDEIKAKVLGVNAHVLVLRYGLDFNEYRDVIDRVLEHEQVVDAGPFLINEMMIARGDRLSGVLVKGVDPEAMLTVLDLPDQIREGTLEGLRRRGALPPTRPDQIDAAGEGDLDAFLRGLSDGGIGVPGPTDADGPSDEALREFIASDAGRGPIVLHDGGLAVPGQFVEDTADAGVALPYEPLPEVEVPSPADVEMALAELEREGQLGLPSDEWENQLLAEEAAADESEGTDDLPGIVVGQTLAENLGIELGDRVKVISPLTGIDVSRFGARTPHSRDFRVIGVFAAGFNEYDSRLVYVDLYEAQRFYDNGDAVTGVEISLKDFNQAGEVASDLQRQLGNQYNTMDWGTLNHNLFTALWIQQVFLSITIATIVFVASFLVIATLIMMVLEKKRDIAILKAAGATDGMILLVFFIQGAIIGAVGTGLGLLLGFGFTRAIANVGIELDPNVYLIDHVPVSTGMAEFWITALVALGICFCATIVPSLWAARMPPAEGVRYE